MAYEGVDVASLRKAFEEAIDGYCKLCKEKNITPEKPFKGSFNVRLSSDLHRKAVLTACERHITLNTIVSEALESYLKDNAPPSC